MILVKFKISSTGEIIGQPTRISGEPSLASDSPFAPARGKTWAVIIYLIKISFKPSTSFPN